jgi:cell division protein ZapD
MLYEFPLSERFRNFLRLEELFTRFALFSARESAADHHVALGAIFDVLGMSGRSDLKSELLQELDRQRNFFAGMRDNPAVATERLEHTLAILQQARQDLSALQGKPGQTLLDHDWLMSVRSRATIPGGACQFDIPSYHAWQQKPAEHRLADLHSWGAHLQPLSHALQVMLGLLRETCQRQVALAAKGTYQMQLSGRAYQLVRVRVDQEASIPEMSANQYLMWVRFTQQEGASKPRPVDRDVPFMLELCNL